MFFPPAEANRGGSHAVGGVGGGGRAQLRRRETTVISTRNGLTSDALLPSSGLTGPKVVPLMKDTHCSKALKSPVCLSVFLLLEGINSESKSAVRWSADGKNTWLPGWRRCY